MRMNLRLTAIRLLLVPLLLNADLGQAQAFNQTRAAAPADARPDFVVIEGKFHDGLGTYAELCLANALIAQSRLAQASFDTTRSRAKMAEALELLPEAHPSRTLLLREIANIEQAARQGAAEILAQAGGNPTRIRHTATEFSGARAGDLALEFADRPTLPISVKTDKSGKVAVAEGQTPDIGPKWAERYFQVSEAELRQMTSELGFPSLAELKADYLNVARLVALILTRKLKLTDAEPTDFSRARVGDVAAAKHLFRQLLHYKRGNDSSRVIIFSRSTGEVKWESLLDAVDIDGLTSERMSFLPSHPRGGRPIGSEFGIRIDGREVVSFQVKHKRGRARGTVRQIEFGDITTRLRI